MQHNISRDKTDRHPVRTLLLSMIITRQKQITGGRGTEGMSCLFFLLLWKNTKWN